ncbi:hypothetical protein [Vibrio harveyi]|uniref:hypothetical protein n=1 Tax=Vibrio harveyi TaxID=669 RepID=UPI00237FAC0D|nr:hypothetical protein [Vibrio harveyi]HDM8052360.1 hypothetical protein [Vibrio harveyi]
MNAILILLAFVFLFVLYIRLYKKTSLLILPIIYVLVGMYTILGEQFFDFSKEVPFDFYNKVNEVNIFYIYFHLIAGSVIYTIGFFVFFKGDINSKPLINFEGISLKVIGNKYIISLFLVTITLLHIGYGFSHIYYREGYTLGEAGVSFARVLYTLFLPLTCLLIPFSKSKFFKFLIPSILFVLVMGTSSRNLVLIPACIFLGGVIRDGKVSFFKSVLSGIMIALSVTISLQSRNYAVQGVVPNILSLFDSGLDFLVMNYAINYLTSYSVFASSLTYQNYSPDLLSLYYSLTPLPSSFIDLEYMVESQKLNANSPFPAFALLALNGPFFFGLYYFLAGSIMAIFGGYLAKKNKSLNLFVVMLILVFSFLSLQYNLRGTTRILYYLVFFSLSFKVVAIIKFNINKYRV